MQLENGMPTTRLANSLTIDRCVTCDQTIPTLIVGEDSSRREWECVNCGTSYLATLAESEQPYDHDRLRLVNFFPLHLQQLPDIHEREPGIDSRRHRRRFLTVKILATKVNDDLCPVGENFEILSRDLSESGIGLLHPEPLVGKYAALIVLPDQVFAQIVIQIVRCEPLGSLYAMGAKFLHRLDT